MKLILGGINGEYLRGVLHIASEETEYVDAAVAYATDSTLLFDWCWEEEKLLNFWGRFDDTVPVALPLLRKFLERKSPNFNCRLVRHFHPKVIWWHGYGAYIGSANLTQAAWYRNVEAGVFFTDAELEAAGHHLVLERLFSEINSHSAPLTTELFDLISKRDRKVDEINARDKKDRRDFEETQLVPQWGGLADATPRSAMEAGRAKFLKEWNSTLQILRDIAATVSLDQNRPTWIPADAPSGAQADQFLHAHYYSRTFDGKHAMYEEHFQRNRTNPALAQDDAIRWWRATPQEPNDEERMLTERSPYIRTRLSRDHVLQMSEDDLVGICHRVNAMRDYARRVPNVDVGLPDGRDYTIPEKADALGKHLWQRRSGNGDGVPQLLYWLLYGGTDAELPDRLWEATTNPARRIDRLGLSSLGELIGWALPERFPPRNSRTSKALRSLGYDVEVYS